MITPIQKLNLKYKKFLKILFKMLNNLELQKNHKKINKTMNLNKKTNKIKI